MSDAEVHPENKKGRRFKRGFGFMRLASLLKGRDFKESHLNEDSIFYAK